MRECCSGYPGRSDIYGSAHITLLSAVLVIRFYPILRAV